MDFAEDLKLMLNSTRKILIKTDLFLGDVLITQVALFLTLGIRGNDLLTQFHYFSYRFFPVYAMWIGILFLLNLYDVYFFKNSIDFSFTILIFCVAGFFVGVSYFYFFPVYGVSPKTIFLINLALFALFFYGWRYVASLIIKKTFGDMPSFVNESKTPEAYEKIHKKVPLEYLKEDFFLKIIEKESNPLEEFLKRAIDLVVAVVGWLLFCFLFPIIALIIKIDSPGHIFYHQKRVGKNGKIFTITKFRTMHEHDNQHTKLWREKEKDTITGFGKILRRLHLDELPQAWSMLKGDLSFVGPRPEWLELAKMFEKEIPFYTKRYLVKPGIIGWAQINFPPSRSLDEVREKFEYDLYYIKNKSLLLDFEIMLKALKLFFW